MTSTTRRHPERHHRGAVYLGIAGGLFAASGALAAGYFVLAGNARADRSAPVSHAAGGPRADPGDFASQVTGALNESVEVVIAGKPVVVRWSDLGVVIDDAELARAAARAVSDEPLGTLRDAGALPVRLDRDRAVAALTALKSRHDRAAVEARLDLEGRAIKAEEAGYGIDVWASLARIDAAARSGVARFDLVGVALPARVSQDSLAITDISSVLGHYETKFSVSDKDRNFNLKLAASKLNGHVIAAGETFSFNTVVGNRTEKEGYKIAHVISAGEMVDGLAGGTCQISTTLFGAAFFAGLDIVDSHAHSRPSTYTPLGFDATVVYPTTDLVLKNPYEFPVVIRYVVASGTAKVEILGKARPYTKVEFVRRIVEQTPFETEERLDSTMPEGATLIDQPGFDGYRIVRHRTLYQGDTKARTDTWSVTYQPVTEYVRKGTNPDPLATVPERPEVHALHAPSAGNGRMVQ